MARQGSECGHGQDVGVVSVQLKCDGVRGNQAFCHGLGDMGVRSFRLRVLAKFFSPHYGVP